MEPERKKSEKALKDGVDACASFQRGAPLSSSEKETLMNTCVKDWLAMAPEKRLEIQAQCARTPQDAKACVGFKTLNPDVPLTVFLQNNVKQLAECEAGKLQAPDLKTKQEFAAWCLAQIQPSTNKSFIDVKLSAGAETHEIEPKMDAGTPIGNILRIGHIQFSREMLRDIYTVLKEVTRQYDNFKVWEVPKQLVDIQYACDQEINAHWVSPRRIPGYPDLRLEELLPPALHKRMLLAQKFADSLDTASATTKRLPKELGVLYYRMKPQEPLFNTDLIVGTYGAIDLRPALVEVRDELGGTVAGFLHTHPPDDFLAPDVPDFEIAALPFMNLEFLILGTVRAETPLIAIYVKRPAYTWDEILTVPFAQTLRSLYPQYTGAFYVQVTPVSDRPPQKDFTYHWHPADLERAEGDLRQFLSTYFDIALIDLRNMQKKIDKTIISADSDIADATTKKDQIRDLLKTQPSLSDEEIARQVGASVQYVADIRLELNPFVSLRTKIRDLLQAHPSLSDEEIAKRVGASVKHVQNVRRKLFPELQHIRGGSIDLPMGELPERGEKLPKGMDSKLVKKAVKNLLLAGSSSDQDIATTLRIPITYVRELRKRWKIPPAIQDIRALLQEGEEYADEVIAEILGTPVRYVAEIRQKLQPMAKYLNLKEERGGPDNAPSEDGDAERQEQKMREEIFELLRIGRYSDKEIAYRMGVSPAYVEQLRVELELSGRGSKKERIHHLLQTYKYTDLEIAEKVGADPNYVQVIRSRMGLAPVVKSRLKRDVIQELLRTGQYSDQEIAVRVGTTVQYVLQIRAELFRSPKETEADDTLPQFAKYSENTPSDNTPEGKEGYTKYACDECARECRLIFPLDISLSENLPQGCIYAEEFLGMDWKAAKSLGIRVPEKSLFVCNYCERQCRTYASEALPPVSCPFLDEHIPVYWDLPEDLPATVSGDMLKELEGIFSDESDIAVEVLAALSGQSVQWRYKEVRNHPFYLAYESGPDIIYLPESLSSLLGEYPAEAIHTILEKLGDHGLIIRYDLPRVRGAPSPFHLMRFAIMRYVLTAKGRAVLRQIDSKPWDSSEETRDTADANPSEEIKFQVINQVLQTQQTPEEIAQYIGVSVDYVDKIRGELQHPSKNWSKVVSLIQAWKLTPSQIITCKDAEEIAASLDLNLRTIRYIMWQLGKTRSPAPPIGTRIRAFFEAGILSDQQIAQEVDLPEATIRQMRSRWKENLNKLLTSERETGGQKLKISEDLDLDRLRRLLRTKRQESLLDQFIQQQQEIGSLKKGTSLYERRRFEILRRLRGEGYTAEELTEFFSKLAEVEGKIKDAGGIADATGEGIFQRHIDEPLIEIEHIRLPRSILEKMKLVIEAVEYQVYECLPVPPAYPAELFIETLITIPENKRRDLPWEIRKLPIEKGFLICMDRNGTLLTSPIHKLSAVGGGFAHNIMLAAKESGLKIIGTFHIHYEGLMDPSKGDFDSAREFNTDFIAIGSVIGGNPVVNILVRRHQQTWNDFLTTALWEVADLIIPTPRLQLATVIDVIEETLEGISEQERLWVYYRGFTDAEVMQQLADVNTLYAPYLEGKVINLTNMHDIPLIRELPLRIIGVMVRLMYYNLYRIPLRERDAVKDTLDGFVPARPEEVYDYFHNRYARLLEGVIKIPAQYAQFLPATIIERWGLTDFADYKMESGTFK